jgi:C-5 cytosine-specific DNA methylase
MDKVTGALPNRTPPRPRLLDLFCGAGGAAMGYARAGFEVVGVDIAPQPRYPFEFHLEDALEFLPLRRIWGDFDAIHASPPCQRWTRAQNAAQNADGHPDLITPLRPLLEATGLPYVIENVVGAPLRDPVKVCGLSLGLGVKRHRLFESNVSLFVPPCVDDSKRDYYVIFGHEVRNRRHGVAAGRKNPDREGPRGYGHRVDDPRRAQRGDPARVHRAHRPPVDAAPTREGRLMPRRLAKRHDLQDDRHVGVRRTGGPNVLHEHCGCTLYATVPIVREVNPACRIHGAPHRRHARPVRGRAGQRKETRWMQ